MKIDLNKYELNPEKMPKHIAIIMDGNGRWAKKRGLPRYLGHQQGMRTLGKVVEAVKNLNIQCLTVFAFSTENWNRPQDEVEYIMTQVVKQFDRYAKEAAKHEIRIKVIGEKTPLSDEVLAAINKIQKQTENYQKMNLVVAFNYGSKRELTETVKQLARKVEHHDLKVDDITPELIDRNLYTSDLPPIDLLIRTSGEMRISNFLLWQLAYAELYFTDTLWPDFDQAALLEALHAYQSRKRRFGKIGEQNE